jgi:GAF domain-containing protein
VHLLERLRDLVPVDGAAVLLVDDARQSVDAAAVWFDSPELRDALVPRRRRPYDPQHAGLVELVLERDRPLLLPRVEDWEAGSRLRAALDRSLDPRRARRAWETFGRGSVVCCPVRTEVGRPIGILAVAALERERPLSAADLRNVEALAELAALAIEREQLLELEARRGREEKLLQRAADDVSASLELELVCRRVVEHALAVTGGTSALLARVEPRAASLVKAATIGDADRAPGRLPADRGALGRVLRTGSPELERGEPPWDGSGPVALMHAPLALGPRAFGVLTVGHEDPAAFDQARLGLLVRLARSSAAAMANALDFQRERQVAQALTLGFVPESLPELPGYECGLLYAPAAGEPTGGDVYGAWRLPGGEVALLVGDVTGKGVETAALSAMTRFFVEARSFDGHDPAAVLERANAMLMGRLPSDTFVTAFLGVLTEERLRWCCAGHLPPLLVRAGAAETLRGHGLPLGVEEQPGYWSEELLLGPGELLFAYSDGLPEARRAGEAFGMARLAALVAERGRELGAEELVSVVHDEVAGWADGLSDDSVALAVRRRP